MAISETAGVALAAVRSSGRGECDRFLTEVARGLQARGIRVGGVVQSNPDMPGQWRCAMVLEELTTGTLISISQNLGRDARGCRLDQGSLEFAATLVESSIARGLDILILNKFGRGEAEGRGFRQSIALAVEAGIPVLVGISEANFEAWREFTGNQAVLLAAEHSAVDAWLDARTGLIPALTTVD